MSLISQEVAIDSDRSQEHVIDVTWATQNLIYTKTEGKQSVTAM